MASKVFPPKKQDKITEVLKAGMEVQKACQKYYVGFHVDFETGEAVFYSTDRGKSFKNEPRELLENIDAVIGHLVDAYWQIEQELNDD